MLVKKYGLLNFRIAVIIFNEGVIMTKYEKDKIVTGYVTGIEKYGIFVNLDEYYSGLIHISEISTGFVRNVSEYVNIGETIKMKVMSVNEKNHQVKLSIKNIDYRIGKKKRTKIVETEHGFDTLKENLPMWISNKIDEFNEEK